MDNASTGLQENEVQNNLASLHASASGAMSQKPPGYSLRGNIDQLEFKLNDVITEIGYHRQQL